MNTNFSTATQNPFKALLLLVKAYKYGYSAKIKRLKNEKCAYPITEGNKRLNDIKNWKSTGSYYISDWESYRKSIETDKNIHPVKKDLLLNYVDAYGTEEEYEKYLETGIPKFLGMGRCFFVKYSDVAKYQKDEYERNWVIAVQPKDRTEVPKKLKRKVFVIVTEKENLKCPWYVKLAIGLSYPLKFIPEKRVLNMKQYTLYMFRIGSVVNGFSIEFHIPKKFSLNN